MSQRVIQDIKNIVERKIRAMRIPDFIIGKVAEDDPLSIETSVNQKTYPESIITVPDHIEKLKKGDEVVLLRALGGQKFLVLGTIGKGQTNEDEEIPEDECPCGCGCKNYSKEPPEDKDDSEDGGGSGKDKGGEDEDDTKKKITP